MRKLMMAGAAGCMAITPLLASTASAELTANLGWVSEYHFRGLFQKTSSASAGLDFDETYEELNLYAGYGPISFEYSVGRYDVAPREYYTFFAVTAEYQGFYATYGNFGRDFAGDYVEAGYGFEVAGLDLSIAWLWSSKKLLDADKDDNTIIFGISNSFALLD